MFGVAKEDIKLVREELKNCDINKQDSKGYTALMYACRFNKKVDIVKLLLNKNADFNIGNKEPQGMRG